MSEIFKNIDYSMFFDLSKYIVMDFLYYFFIGGRGCGKTFSFKRTVCDRFLKDGKQFVYVRRTEEEIKGKKLKGFFNILKIRYPDVYKDVEFGYKQGEFFINGQVAGYAMSLSRAQADKGINDYPDVWCIIVDEFIIKTDRYHQYFEREPEMLEDLIESVARLNDIPVFFFANNVSYVNPYFLYYLINFTPNSPRVFKRGEFYAENLDMSEYRRFKEQTRRSRALKGTRYYEYAVENQSLTDDKTNIKKKTGECRLIAAIVIDGVKLGVWKSMEYMVYYISENAANTNIIYTFDFNSVGNQRMLLNYKSLIIKNLMCSFENGLLYYESQKCKNIFMKIIKR